MNTLPPTKALGVDLHQQMQFSIIQRTLLCWTVLPLSTEAYFIAPTDKAKNNIGPKSKHHQRRRILII